MYVELKVEVNPRRQGKYLHEVHQTKIAAQTLIRQYNSSSLYLFQTIWLAAEKVLHFDKFNEQESRNYFPSAGS